MPYLVLGGTSALAAFKGPVVVGDADSNIELMAKLGAHFDKKKAHFESPYPARLLLDILEKEGWRVVGMSGGDTKPLWTMHRP